MRLTILCAPGSDTGEARARASAVLSVDAPSDVAAAAAASRDAYVMLLGRGARPLPGAFGGLTAALEAQPGVLGGATVGGGIRLFGWMLGPAPVGPLPFELVPVVAGAAERGIDAAVRGPIDVVAPGMVLARRELLLAPLPAEPVAAMLELCARARESDSAVVCRPAFACEVNPDSDDRGLIAAVRAVSERRPELVGAHRLPAGMRRSTVERQVRLAAGRLFRMRVRLPAVTVIVHGTGAEAAVRRVRAALPGMANAYAVEDAAAALRAEMRVRGDRYILIADAARLPDSEGFDRLVTALEGEPYVAVAAPEAAALDGSCVLLAAGRFPQHVAAAGTTIANAIASLLAATAPLRLAVRAPGYVPPTLPPVRPGHLTAVFLASSLPEITRMSLDAMLAGLRSGDEIVAVAAEHGETVRRLLAAYPQVRIEGDAIDPLLAVGANRAIGSTTTELVLLIADDVMLTSGTIDRLRTAFERVPGLGAAFPAIPGAPGAEGVLDATYADLAQLLSVAEERASARIHELEPIDLAVSPVLAVARAALEAVGGIDPALGPTRRGIADLVVRLRSAGYAVVRCDDAFAHRFDVGVSRNPAAAADAGQPAPASPDAARLALGFDPATRVSFSSFAEAGLRAPASHAIVIPVGNAEELERAAQALAAAAAAFDARSPVRVHIVLDGAVAAAEAVARLRPVLAAGGLPLGETITVRVERVTDLAAWWETFEPGVSAVVAAGHERPALAGLPTVTGSSIAKLLVPVTR